MAFVLYSCTKVDTLPQLEIQVLDENGANISGAYVALFDSADEWNNRINPIQVWRRTDSDGKVVFVDLKEITYYVYVRFDGKDNSVGEVSTSEPLQVNQRNKIVVHVR
ncbi:MAG: carboxypeptidase regulatory-like domain-containing protein [Porphyromonadaceae bacterium]|nr:MAG: carboxypeptidase regulatory-like domain-containing protein [Porphyromonadaceae bacterium]